MTPTNPARMSAFQVYVHTAGSLDLRGFAATTLRRGEPVSFTLPFAPFVQTLPPGVRAGVAENVTMEVTFTGYVRLGAAVAVALRAKISNILKDGPFAAAKGTKGEEWLDDVIDPAIIGLAC